MNKFLFTVFEKAPGNTGAFLRALSTDFWRVLVASAQISTQVSTPSPAGEGFCTP